MEATSTCFFCGRIPSKSKLSSSSSFGSFCLLTKNNVNTIMCTRSFKTTPHNRVIQNVNETKLPSSNTKRRRRRRTRNGVGVEEQQEQREIETPFENMNKRSVVDVNVNGDPIGWKDVGKSVVCWIRESMKSMAFDFASAELQGDNDFFEMKQKMGPGLTFVIQAQPYLNAVPMPLGLEVMCLKACTHYPTLFDHFQRELRDVLQDMESKLLVQDWRETQSWKLLKELANSGSFYSLFVMISTCFIVHNI